MEKPTAPSEGQQQAVASLKAIIEASGDDLLIDAGYQRMAGTWLELRVWLSTARIPTSDKGIALAEREPVDICIPEDFPFRHPEAASGHTRFAGQPHVQWGNQLCLHASSSEWDPSAGMAGFLRRLLAFYEHLALGTLGGPLAPWHPPVAYTDDEAGCVVVAADLAPADRTRPGSFLRWAIGVPMAEDRVDIVDWLELCAAEQPREHLTGQLMSELTEARKRTGCDDAFLVPAVILPEPIAFEYPQLVRDLLAAVDSAGTKSYEVVEHLTCTIWTNKRLRAEPDNDAREPTMLVVRAPADKRFTTADPAAYFAAWRFAGADEAALATDASSGGVLERLRDWLEDAEISWAWVYDTRPEAVIRRDTGRPAEKLRGSHILILGCGALGAPIAEHCVRAGAAIVHIVDRGVVGPGLLVRQPYDDADIGLPKATVLAHRLRSIWPQTRVVGLVANVLSFPVLNEPGLSDYDLVIDATADRSVAARIEQWRRDKPHLWPDLVTVGISQTARRGIAAITPRGSTGAGVDLLRRLALATCEDPALADVYREFFPPPEQRIEFEPERGCSGPTFIGSHTDVTALAAQLLDSALAASGPCRVHVSAVGQAEYMPHQRSLCIVRLGGDDGSAPARTHLLLPHDRVAADQNGTYQIRIDQRAWEQMHQAVRQAAATDATRAVTDVANAASETGGLLLGQFDDACRVVWVSEATGPPDGSFASPLCFAINTPAAREDVRERSRQTRGLISFVGLWHTHPGGLAWPSETDTQAVEKLLAEARLPSPRFLLLILGLPGSGAAAVDQRPQNWNPGIYAEVLVG